MAQYRLNAHWDGETLRALLEVKPSRTARWMPVRGFTAGAWNGDASTLAALHAALGALALGSPDAQDEGEKKDQPPWV